MHASSRLRNTNEHLSYDIGQNLDFKTSQYSNCVFFFSFYILNKVFDNKSIFRQKIPEYSNENIYIFPNKQKTFIQRRLTIILKLITVHLLFSSIITKYVNVTNLNKNSNPKF